MTTPHILRQTQACLGQCECRDKPSESGTNIYTHIILVPPDTRTILQSCSPKSYISNPMGIIELFHHFSRLKHTFFFFFFVFFPFLRIGTWNEKAIFLSQEGERVKWVHREKGREMSEEVAVMCGSWKKLREEDVQKYFIADYSKKFRSQLVALQLQAEARNPTATSPFSVLVAAVPISLADHQGLIFTYEHEMQG